MDCKRWARSPGVYRELLVSTRWKSPRVFQPLDELVRAGDDGASADQNTVHVNEIGFRHRPSFSLRRVLDDEIGVHFTPNAYDVKTLTLPFIR